MYMGHICSEKAGVFFFFLGGGASVWYCDGMLRQLLFVEVCYNEISVNVTIVVSLLEYVRCTENGVNVTTVITGVCVMT